MRVLIVEDDHNTLNGLQELLSYEGYVVYGASCGAEAIDIVEREGVNIVLCDYSLPDINGAQLCYALKKLQPNLIICMITAYFNNEIPRLLKQGIIKKNFRKPLIIEELLKTLTLSITKVNLDSELISTNKNWDLKKMASQ